MTEAQYFECENCEQVVQGWGASRDIDCCEEPNFVEIHGPEAQHLLTESHTPDAALTKSGNWRKA